MRIAAHHIKGTPENEFSALVHTTPDHTPVCPWPDDCLVQWGNGIVPANPFFEAFIPGTMFRGDGESIEEAERRAFAQYESEKVCAHIWGRQRRPGNVYMNGAGWCRKCHAFRSHMFAEVITFGTKRKPLSGSETWLLESYNDEEMNAHMAAKYPDEIARREKKKRELEVRLKLFGTTENYF